MEAMKHRLEKAAFRGQVKRAAADYAIAAGSSMSRPTSPVGLATRASGTTADTLKHCLQA